jgi:hypothetical protein
MGITLVPYLVSLSAEFQYPLGKKDVFDGSPPECI